MPADLVRGRTLIKVDGTSTYGFQRHGEIRGRTTMNSGTGPTNQQANAPGTEALRQGQPPSTCDVAIIGGGPAGSMSAALLAQQGYDVVLIERGRHPREHVGESVLPHVWKYCDAAGVTPMLEAEGFLEKAGGTVVWGNEIRQMRFKDFGYGRPALHVERDRFDEILFRNAYYQGAQTFEGLSVTEVGEPDDKGARTLRYRSTEDDERGELRCRMLVDASGQHSMLARQYGLRELDRNFRFMAMWGYFENSMYAAPDGMVYAFERRYEIPPTTFVSSVGSNQGWLWHIPMRNQTSVGLVLPLDEVKGRGAGSGREDFYLSTVRGLPYVDGMLLPARYVPGSFRMVRDYSYYASRYVGPGFALNGDAAAIVDPIFSLGVNFAMYSAYASAWAIDRGFRRPAGRDRYLMLYDTQLRQRVEVARALALPTYRTDSGIDTNVREFVRLENREERSLMKTVASLTNRSENFVSLLAGVEDLDSKQLYTELDDLSAAG